MDTEPRYNKENEHRWIPGKYIAEDVRKIGRASMPQHN